MPDPRPAPRRRARRTTPAAAGARRPTPKPNDVPVRLPGQRHAASVAARRRRRGCGRRSDPAARRRRARPPRAGRAPRPGRGRPSRAARARRASPRARGACRARGRAPASRRPTAATRCRACSVGSSVGGSPGDVGQPVPGRVAHDVVVRQHPGRRRARLRREREVVGDDVAGTARRRSPPASRSKLNAWPRPSALAYRGRRSRSTHASATAVRGGSYSLKTARHSA